MKRTVAKLEMSGKEEHALAELEKAVERVKKGKKLHEAYEIEMLLVEMLIYKVYISYSLSFLTQKPNLNFYF